MWAGAPGAYRAQCSSANGGHVLEIVAQRGAPALQPVPSPAWGLHLVDANITLGNLISIVRAQAAAYVARGG